MLKIEGNIQSIRAIEDAIRATKHYSEGITTQRAKHPIQGTDIPTKAFTKTYEIYLDSEYPDWNTKLKDFWNWLDSQSLVIYFFYDYRSNQANMRIEEKYIDAVCKLIAGFREALDGVTAENSGLPGLPQQSGSESGKESVGREQVADKLWNL